MKGIIMQCGEEKSIVLFNNGKIGEIPTPANGEEGMVITVSYNKKMITLLGILTGLILIFAIFIFASAYTKPIGFVQINHEGTSIELAYNRFNRVLLARPLNIQAVEPLTSLRLNNTGIKTAYKRILHNTAQGTVVVRIARDNLVKARELEQSLSILDVEPTVTFELYTHELYRQVMSALPEPPPPGRNRHMPRRQQGNQQHHRR